MFSKCVTLLFFLDIVISFNYNINKYNLSHIIRSHKDLDIYDHVDDVQLKKDLRGFLYSLSPIRLPDIVIDNWYNRLLKSGIDLHKLHRILPYSDPSVYKVNDSTNRDPYPFESSRLDEITPLIGSDDKEELNQKYEDKTDQLSPEYILTECLISAIRELYGVISEKNITYDDDWEVYEEGIREGLIDQNISENYYLPTPDGQIPKLRGLERYYRERVKSGYDPIKEAEKIVNAMKHFGSQEDFKFDFNSLPPWTRDISLAMIRYFATKTNDDKLLEMLSEMGSESQSIRNREIREREVGKKYVDYCFSRRKKPNWGPHKSPNPFWFWHDVVNRISSNDDCTIDEILNNIKRTDSSCDVDKIAHGTLDPYYMPSNSSLDDIARIEVLKAISPPKEDRPKPTEDDFVGVSDTRTRSIVSELLPGFNPPVHIANYFKDCLSQTKFDDELKKYNLKQFGSEEYKLYLGQIVNGTITMIDTQIAHVDIGAHMTATLPIREVFDDPKTIPLGGLNMVFKEGDSLMFEIKEMWPDEIVVSLLSIRELYKLKPILEHHQQNKPMLFTVKDYYTKGLYGEVFGYRAFIPKTHLSFDYQDSIRLYRPGLEGTKIPVMYLGYNFSDRVLVVSNCRAIEHDQVKFIRIGDILRCKPHQITKYGLLLKATNVHCIMSPYEMSKTHFEQYQKGFLCTNEIFAQVIGINKTPDGSLLVSLSSRRRLNDDIIISPNKIITFNREKRGVNEFIKDWKKSQLTGQNISNEVSINNDSKPIIQDQLKALESGQFSILTETPEPKEALDKLFNDKVEDGEVGIYMDLDDDDYIKNDNVFKDYEDDNMVWYIETIDGCMELSGYEQRYLTNAYNQKDQVVRYILGGKHVMVDFERGIYYNIEDDKLYKLFNRDLQQRLGS